MKDKMISLILNGIVEIIDNTGDEVNFRLFTDQFQLEGTIYSSGAIAIEGIDISLPLGRDENSLSFKQIAKLLDSNRVLRYLTSHVLFAIINEG